MFGAVSVRKKAKARWSWIVVTVVVVVMGLCVGFVRRGCVKCEVGEVEEEVDDGVGEEDEEEDEGVKMGGEGLVL